MKELIRRLKSVSYDDVEVDSVVDTLYADLVGLVASFEVKSLPSDDPELRYWQGYHDAQLHITKALRVYIYGEEQNVQSN